MKKIIFIVSILVISTILTATIAPSLVRADILPQFNYMTGDLKTLNVANRTTNTGWQNSSVSASANNSVAFQIYYHNGVVGSVAHNTRVRLTFPTSGQNNINVNVSLSADNASAMSDYVMVNSAISQKLSFDTAAVLWYPNRSATPTIVPATSSGEGYIELNMGDIQGCWEYQGYVTFVANLVPASVTEAVPQFNIFTPYAHTQTYNRDYYLLDAKNDTKYTNWGFPVAADANDVLTFYIYYHNGINYSTARNTTLRVNLPTGSASSHSVTGYLWADNASNAMPSSPLSQSVPINLSSSQTLQYIAGSAKWFPNQSNWQTTTPTPFPNGQSDTQLFSSGINIGDIVGCWEFSGAITFQVRVSNVQLTPTLTISKQVKNITTQDIAWTKSLINAHPRQRLAVQLTISNNGQGAANNVIVRDTLPNNLTYVYGSTKIDGNSAGDGITYGLNIGSLSPGQTKVIYFETILGNEVNFVRGTTNLTNLAGVKADNLSEVQDTASISVYYDGCSSTMPPYR